MLELIRVMQGRSVCYLFVFHPQRQITVEEGCWSFIDRLGDLLQKRQSSEHLIHHIKTWIFF